MKNDLKIMVVNGNPMLHLFSNSLQALKDANDKINETIAAQQEEITVSSTIT